MGVYQHHCYIFALPWPLTYFDFNEIMSMSEDSLLKFEIPEIIYGEGALSQIGQCARRLGGERILLVTDPGLIAAGWVEESIKYLR